MRLPSLSFIVLHYAYIIFFALLGFIIIAPQGNIAAIDALFFGASGCTESGLNTVDVMAIPTYQQLAIYFIPIFTNLAFVNILVVVARLYWFNRELKKHHSKVAQSPQGTSDEHQRGRDVEQTVAERPPFQHTAIKFAPDTRPAKGSGGGNAALHVPGPKQRDQGLELVEVLPDGYEHPRTEPSPGDDSIRQARPVNPHLRSRSRSRSLSRGRVVSITGATTDSPVITRVLSAARGHQGPDPALPALSSHVTLGRNSSMYNLTKKDKELLGGAEYKALKLLLKLTLIYFFGLHLFGSIGLLGWIHRSPAKYTDYLDSIGQNRTWWAFYSASTMVNNLGFTLTPDSMITFRDATWPMLLMTFLAFAGNTCYPILLRLMIWTISKVVSKSSPMQEPLQFLLKHPRRCYTLLFPSTPTWVLFGVLLALNFIDTLLIVVLDLDNPEVTALAPGPRVLAALFQAASSRHTGTSTFNLANVNPAVQFSLLIMMYIAVFPIAISIRASNTYEERSLGIWEPEPEYGEGEVRSYFLTHMRNQLGFDLWYIFAGVFCITIAESSKIVDAGNPAFNLFAILFEVTSAYGNVGLSLGHPDVMTSLSGQFTVFSKFVVCCIMIRGRHRMLPSNIDRAVMLSTTFDQELEDTEGEHASAKQRLIEGDGEMAEELRRHHTR